MAIKNNLKTLRKNKKLTLEEVARRSKISLQGYINIEKGKSIPNLDTAYRIAHSVGERIEVIFLYKKPKKK